jgi:hypothetical protein
MIRMVNYFLQFEVYCGWALMMDRAHDEKAGESLCASDAFF